jgi:hypothetical protein
VEAHRRRHMLGGWSGGGEYLGTLPPTASTPIAADHVKDQLGDQRGGSEWEPIKILLLSYTASTQPRIPT